MVAGCLIANWQEAENFTSAYCIWPNEYLEKMNIIIIIDASIQVCWICRLGHKSQYFAPIHYKVLTTSGWFVFWCANKVDSSNSQIIPSVWFAHLYTKNRSVLNRFQLHSAEEPCLQNVLTTWKQLNPLRHCPLYVVMDMQICMIRKRTSPVIYCTDNNILTTCKENIYDWMCIYTCDTGKSYDLALFAN